MKATATKGLLAQIFSKALLPVLVISLLSCIVTVNVCAQTTQSSFFDENYNYSEEASKELSNEVIFYNSMDASLGSTVSQSVTDVIIAYRTALLGIGASDEAKERSLKYEIDALKAKGLAAGKLAWIYHYNLTSLSSQASMSLVKAQYTEFQSQISEMTDAEVVSAEGNLMCSKLNRLIYIEKMEALGKVGDSALTLSIITGTKGTLANINDSTICADELSVIFSALCVELDLQRARDSIMHQIETLFPIIKPGEEISENDAYLNLLYTTKNADNIALMNKSFADSIEELTKPASGQVYLKKFQKSLKQKINEAVNKANAEGSWVDILPFFENYAADHSKAETKDTISNILLSNGGEADENLLALEVEFNQSGGIIDQCQDTALLQREIIYASHRRQLYDKKKSLIEKINLALGSYNGDTLKARAENAYTEYVKKLISAKGKDACQSKCEAILIEATERFEELFDEARAERYLQENKNILQKSKESINANDEYPLRAAILSYISLEKSVRELLGAQADNIVEKYNICITQKARGLVENDTLFQDLCDILCLELKSISTNNIELFYNKCDLVFKKAQSVSRLVLYYRELLSSPTYATVGSTEKQALLDTCKSGARKISNVSISEESEFDTALELCQAAAILALDHCAECARVQLSTRGSQSQQIIALASEACTAIRACTDKGEMISVADKAIFKIERELTKEEIEKRCDLLTLNIKKMNFISESEKEAYLLRIKDLRSTAASDAEIAKNITVLSFAWESFYENLLEISTSADTNNLEKAKQKYVNDFEKEVLDFVGKMGKMEYISSSKCDEFSNLSAQLIVRLKNEIVAETSCDGVSQIQLKYLAELNILSSSAQNENLNVYKQKISESLDKFKFLKEEYSAENYKKIEQEIMNAHGSLALCKSIGECASLLNAATERISKISSLLDEAKANAKALLDAALRTCRASSSQYSESSMNKIDNIYNDAIAKINFFALSSDIPQINAYLSQTLISIKSINKDITYSSNQASEVLLQGGTYPDGYEISNGFYASISSPEGISSDAHFSAIKIQDDQNLKEIQKLIRSSAKKGALITDIAPSHETLKILKKCVIAYGLDISLTSIISDTEKYTVKMLMPSDSDFANIIGVAFVTESGNVEFYNISKADDQIVFDISHFSNYYIVSESTTNLRPLIIFLSIMLSIELAALFIIFIMHLYRKRKEKKMIPFISAYSFNPLVFTFALKIIPQNGVGLVALLSVGILALGCGIAILAKLELSAWKKRPGASKTKNIPYSQSDSNVTHELPEESKIPLLCISGSSEMIEIAEESDFDIETLCAHCDEVENFESIKEERKIRRAEINLDVIANSFSSGELVTLDALKKRRLIGKRIEYVKVLARGSLTKPLIVEAHDFSHAAEEMLKAVGGEAIRISK